MITIRIGGIAGSLILSFFYLAALPTVQAAVEDTLAELNAEPYGEREKILIENARKEGTVTLYAATNLRDTREVVAGFNNRQSRLPHEHRILMQQLYFWTITSPKKRAKSW